MSGHTSCEERVLPYPPEQLRLRVGATSDDEYEAAGRTGYEQVMRAVPAEWSWDGKRVLDFGCGAGRVLRQFLSRRCDVELWGCDVDEPSISWLEKAFGEDVNAVVVRDEPGLPVPARHFDFIYAISVFTHLTQHWAGWMAELHRVLADDGLLLATFLGPDWAPHLAGEEPWSENQVGMVVLGEGNTWDEGGPATILSEWWLRAHWGRGFEIVSLDPSHAPEQGAAVLRKRGTLLGAEDWERPDTDIAREFAALTFAYRASLKDVVRQRALHEQRLASCREQLETALACHDQLQSVLESKSWRLTAPLRGIAARAGRR